MSAVSHWWVNQSKTFKAERAGSFLWAPHLNRTGHKEPHWTTMSMVRPDDLILHYASGSIRAISKALGAAATSPRPASLPPELWEPTGWYLDVQISDLATPIARDDIPQSMRLNPDCAVFNRDGKVNQGYLFPVDVDWFAQFSRLFADQLPDIGSVEALAPAEATGGAANLLRSLIGQKLQTITGSPNTILGVSETHAKVATDKSPDGEKVQINEVETALEQLLTTGEVVCDPPHVGYRSAFIGAVLRTLPGVDVGLAPPTVTLVDRAVTNASGSKSTIKAPTGPTDILVSRYARTEQAPLRRALIANRTMAPCDLCSREMPVELLVAAHIKKRQRCSEKERNDRVNIGMLACKFGCDDLYELGYITVDRAGVVWTVKPDAARHGDTLTESIARVRGRRCRAFTEANSDYFEWHRTNTFRINEAEPVLTSA
ncbi:MAG TPA: hypothetical protein VGN81_10710 [Pseudonocardiaceae bacterium]